MKTFIFSKIEIRINTLSHNYNQQEVNCEVISNDIKSFIKRFNL